jgi:predicted transcriptional regulator
MKNRSRIDIFSHILEATANGGATTKTKIMCKACLNYEQLKEYVALLLENGLLDYDKKNAEYNTTEKGINFLKAYNKIGEVMKVET